MQTFFYLVFFFLSFLSLSNFINANKLLPLDSRFREQQIYPPQRDWSLIISQEGNYPQTLVLFKGERVRLYVTTHLSGGSCLMIPSKDFFLHVKKGEIAEGLLFFNKAGTYTFSNCPAGKIQGKIVVLNR